jgi:WD40 repeat protein
MPTLELLPGIGSGGHNGDVFACAYTPDSALLLSAGWDGCLRLWDAAQGAPVSEIRAGSKPLSACAVAPDGRRWYSGSMEGLLSSWDPQSQRQGMVFLAHTRPISAIVFSPDGNWLATASWDRQVTLWNPKREREGRSLLGHNDIVAGCRFTPDSKNIISWSYDGTLRLWEVARARQVNEFLGHTDRVTAAAISPDGRWVVSGTRDRVVRLWDVQTGSEVRSLLLTAEVRGCFFLLDAESLVVVDANGRLTLHTLPDLQIASELPTRLPVQCGELAPSGARLALGCGDGRVHFVAVDGLESVPLAVTATKTSRTTASMFQRLFGRSQVTQAYQCTCPACRQSFELPGVSSQSAACPNCRRHVRVCAVTQA